MMKTTPAMRWKKWRRAGLFSLAFFGATNLYAAQDNKGTDFIVGFLPNHSSYVGKSVDEIHLTSDVPTTVTVEYPVNSPSFTKTVSVSPGVITTVSFPNTNPAYSWTNNAVTNNAVHAYANDEFILYMVNKQKLTSDAALALPVDVLGTDYIVMSYNPNLPSEGSNFAVYATEDNTTVTITPSALFSSHPAGTPFKVTLKRGEGYFAQANVDLTGTFISANKPVGLSNGVACVKIGKGKCDHLFQMAPPISAWGTTALVSDLPNGVQYRILAAENGTTVSQDGSPISSTLAAGHFHSTSTLSGNHVFEANKPILVAAFMEGSDNNLGDPAMGNIVPPEQFLNRYTFSTIGGGLFSQHHLQVTVDNSETSTITLDDSPIGANNFTAIKGTGYSIATITLPEGSHNTVSKLGHGIFVIGLANRNSYLYPGGTQLGGIIIGNNTPVVANVNVGGTPVVNSALTVSYTYSDTEGDLEGASTFQWLVASDAAGTNKVAISGATNNTYTLTTSDLKKYITVEVTPVAKTGTTVSTPVEASFVGPAINEEPSTHLAGFGATAGISSITLNWSDSVDASGYLIMCNVADSFTAPVDGTAQIDDTNCSDGGVKNIAQGVGTYTWTGLNHGTPYFFRVYPYSNGGTNIDYKTDGTVPLANTTTTSINAPGGVSGNLVMWMTANVGVTESDGSVSVWNDQSLNGYNATAPNKGPDATTNTINFNPALHFTQANKEYLEVANQAKLNPTNNMTMFVVGSYTSTTDYHPFVSKTDDGGWDNGYGITTISGQDVIAFWKGDWDGTDDSSYPRKKLNVSQVAVMTGYYDANGHNISINGGASDTRNTATPNNTTLPLKIGMALDSYYLDGNIAEVIFYNSAISTVERQKVESYLSIKYGITKSGDYVSSDNTTVWTSGGGYDNDIAGIARDDVSSLAQQKSKSINSSALVTIDNGAAFGTDKSFLVWGNNGGATTSSDTSPKIMPRIWKVAETGTVGTVTINYVPGSAITHLWVDDDGDFTSGVTSYALTASSASVDFTNGQYFTFVTEAFVAPEPSAYPTGFGVTRGTTSITLNWSDSVDASGYLIMCNVANSFTAPVDGTAQTDNTNCFDGGVKNIAQGIRTYTWIGLNPSTPYFFRIYPYSNSGTDIDYKIDGTVPVAEENTTSYNGSHEMKNGAHIINLVSGQVMNNINFGNTKLGIIQGMKWNDRNGDGKIDEGEPGLADVIIFLDLNDDGVRGENEPSQTTDEKGHYRFSNLRARTYVVREVVPDGYRQTYPPVLTRK